MKKAGKFVAQCGAVFTFCVEIETRVESERERVFIQNIRRTISFKVQHIKVYGRIRNKNVCKK